MTISERRSRKLAKRAKQIQHNHHGMVTRNKSLRACQGAVLNTVELFEKILQNLPITDLAKARRVSRRWTDLIDRSLPLQQALFLAPCPDQQTWINEEGTNSLRLFCRGSPRERDAAWVNRQRQCVPVKINPFLLLRDKAAAAGEVSIRQRFLRAETLTMAFLPDLQPCPVSRGFDNMFLTQPPAREVKIEVNCNQHYFFQDSYHFDAETRWVNIKRSTGVTWNDLQTAIREKLSYEGREAVRTGCFEFRRLETKIWAIGVVAYNAKEADDIDSGRERHKEEAAEDPRWRIV